MCEWDLSLLQKALVPSMVLGFMAVGSVMSGKLADTFGRLPVLLVSKVSERGPEQ